MGKPNLMRHPVNIALSKLCAVIPPKSYISDTNTKSQSTMSYGGGQKVQKVMVQPINLIFR